MQVQILSSPLIFYIMKYTLFFEFFGHKMKTSVQANNVQEAKQKVRDRIAFISIQEQDDTLDRLKDMFGFR